MQNDLRALDRKDEIVATLDTDQAPARPVENIVTHEPMPHHVVVVGGGAGGLELVTRLGDRFGKRGKAQVTLIDKARTHLWKPLLHEVAAGSMDVDEHDLDYLAQAHWHHFRSLLEPGSEKSARPARHVASGEQAPAPGAP